MRDPMKLAIKKECPICKSRDVIPTLAKFTEMAEFFEEHQCRNCQHRFWYMYTEKK